MANNRQSTPHKKTAIDSVKLRLSAPSTAEGKWATLSWGLFYDKRGNAQAMITVYTNDPNDMTEKTNNGRIQAVLDLPTFYIFLDRLNKIAAHEGETREKISTNSYVFLGRNRSDKPLPQSDVILGKDAEGVVKISVVSFQSERPRITFTFGPHSDPKTGVLFHNLFKGDGTPFSKGELSVAHARAYSRILEKLIEHLSIELYVEPEPYNPGGNNGGGRGGYDNRSNNNGGGQASSGGFDDLF